jgi:hypothetical protein
LLSGGVRSLPQVPWWDADRRAAPAGVATASRRTRTEGYASIGVPPSCFYSSMIRKSGIRFSEKIMLH